MSDPAWPGTVPYEPEIDGYDEEVRSNLSSFSPDVGPPTSWRRSTLDSSNVRATILMTGAEYTAFMMFFRTTLADGSLAFEWDNPAYSATGRYKFSPDQAPRRVPAGPDLWRVSFSAIRLGDAA